MPKPDEYRRALEDLDRMRAAGQITQASYDLNRTKLLAEAARPRRRLTTEILLFMVFVLVGILLLRLLFTGHL